MPNTPEQLFDLVAGVDKYPEFLPWCKASRISRREGKVFYADLVIGYKMVRERFSSRVTLHRPKHIHVEYLSGPMKYLSNHWKFIDNDDGTNSGIVQTDASCSSTNGRKNSHTSGLASVRSM